MIDLETREMIKTAAKRACANAEFDFDQLAPGITPLFEIIASYPLRVVELPEPNLRLRYSTAFAFISRELGQTIPASSEEDCSLSGFLYAHEFTGNFYGFILTEKSDPTTRRRYSAAHELGHYLLHVLPLLEVRAKMEGLEELVWTEGHSFNDNNEAEAGATTGRPSVTFKSGQEVEREANIFAAELLMPEHTCRAYAENYRSQFKVNKAAMTRRMANDFFVSVEAMRWRLIDLGLHGDDRQ